MIFLLGICSTLGTEPPTFDAPGPIPSVDILSTPFLQKSPVKIDPEAYADGLHVTYRIFPESGIEEITGTQFLANRLRELQAIATLRAMNKSGEFGKALLKSGGEKIQSVGAAVKDPVGTVKALPKGASKFFGKVGNAIKSVGDGQVGATEAVEAAAGVYRKKAELALKLGVSPFSTDTVLQAELTAAARAMAAGATLMNFSGLIVGGGIGTAISAVNMNQTFQRALIESSPTELEMKNRSALQALGASAEKIQGVLGNPAFSPWHKAAIVVELANIGCNPDSLLAQASQASSPEDAVYFVQMARLFGKHHKDIAPIAAFSEMNGIPYAIDHEGTLLVAVGTDLILWTPQIESRADEFLALKQSKPDIRSILLATDGSISPRAIESLQAKGIEATPQALGPVK